jgi:hypothetical protein
VRAGAAVVEGDARGLARIRAVDRMANLEPLAAPALEGGGQAIEREPDIAAPARQPVEGQVDAMVVRIWTDSVSWKSIRRRCKRLPGAPPRDRSQLITTLSISTCLCGLRWNSR